MGKKAEPAETTSGRKKPKSPGRPRRGELYDETQVSDNQPSYFGNPENILIRREEQPERHALRKKQKAYAKRVVREIKQLISEDCDSDKTQQVANRRLTMWQLRAEGYTHQQIADALEISRSTVQRDWRFIQKTAKKVHRDKYPTT